MSGFQGVQNVDIVLSSCVHIVKLHLEWKLYFLFWILIYGFNKALNDPEMMKCDNVICMHILYISFISLCLSVWNCTGLGWGVCEYYHVRLWFYRIFLPIYI